MFKINTRSNKFYLDAKNGGFYVNKDSRRTLFAYNGGGFYGAGGQKFLGGGDFGSNPADLGLQITFAGFSFSYNNWITYESYGDVYDAGLWNASPNFNLRDDGNGLATIGYVDAINGFISDSMDASLRFRQVNDNDREIVCALLSNGAQLPNSQFRMRLAFHETAQENLPPTLYLIECYAKNDGNLGVRDWIIDTSYSELTRSNISEWLETLPTWDPSNYSPPGEWA